MAVKKVAAIQERFTCWANGAANVPNAHVATNWGLAALLRARRF
jgi:hypothetical protein